jgi:hypothetical protein
VQEHIAKYSWHKGHDDNSRILIHGSSWQRYQVFTKKYG